MRNPIILAASIASLLPAAVAAQQREPEAMAALNKMGASLRQLQAFTVTADVTDEDVLTNGQKLQWGGTVTIRTQRPNRFRIDSHSESKDRTIYYDGRPSPSTHPA